MKPRRTKKAAPATGGTVTFATQTLNSLVASKTILVTFNATVQQGSIAVFSTTQVAFCTAMLISVGDSIPTNGIGLHMVRLNPIPGAGAE